MAFPRITELAHEIVSRFLHPGDHAVDATVGNGHDTRFLAEQVGRTGRVDGFDIQTEAIAATRRSLNALGEAPQVHLHLLGHERMREIITTPVSAVLFNLGYLPSGDRSLVTRPDSTRIALESSWDLLSPGGILSVVVYPGHEGGREEASQVEGWFARVARSRHRVFRCGPAFPDTSAESPYLLAAERRKQDD